MMSRDYSSSWCTHGVYMYSRDSEYDVKAHVYSMVALVRGYEVEI